MLQAGPESAGAHPGPVAYRKEGGQLAITDANLVLGRIIPDFFPKIFGPSEDQPLDGDGARWEGCPSDAHTRLRTAFPSHLP